MTSRGRLPSTSANEVCELAPRQLGIRRRRGSIAGFAAARVYSPSMTTHEALWPADLFEKGIGWVIVARFKSAGQRVETGVFEGLPKV